VDDVKVFISWSKEPSRSIARAINSWLPVVAQNVHTWMSDEAIGSGMRWNDQIAEALEKTDFGIVCVTAANQHEPWLLFEAGALAKRLDVARLVPLCIDLPPSAITGPLATFQGRPLDADGMKRLFQDIIAIGQNPELVRSARWLFDAAWPRLKVRIDDTIVLKSAPAEPVRSQQNMLQELVDRVRRLERSQSRDPAFRPDPTGRLDEDRITDILEYFITVPVPERKVLVRSLNHLPPEATLDDVERFVALALRDLESVGQPSDSAGDAAVTSY
jgi:hypothetical protein